MRGKIEKRGSLFIERAAGQMRTQYCPFAAEEINCGDWCPQFGEPTEGDQHFFLAICMDKLLNFTDFTDERG